jgi:hypothetical protein
MKQAAVVFVIAFVVAQIFRPERANPPIDLSRTIQAHLETTSVLPAILNRACSDCHSNATVWPWYSEIAPLSWLMARAVSEGRKAVNFSEWAGYSPNQQRALLTASCDAASTGRMPGVWTRLRPDTRLSHEDVETICTASRRADAQAARAPR